jgi:hypothetical protein
VAGKSYQQRKNLAKRMAGPSSDGSIPHGCISLGNSFKDATHGGVVLSFLKSIFHYSPSRLFITNSKIRTQHFVLCLLISVFCLLYLPCAAVAGTENVVVGWNPSPSPVAGYEFCYGTSSRQYDYFVDVGKNTSCSISGLEKGTTYYFAVKAYNADWLKSEYSEELTYTIPVATIDNDKDINRVTDGLLAFYTFDEGSGLTVLDTSGVGEPLDLTVDSGTVYWISGGLAISDVALLKSAEPATKIIEACKATNEISIEAWVKPANTTQAGPARIVTLSKNLSYRNFTLGQQGNTYDQRLLTTDTDINGRPSLATPKGFLSTKLTHVLYTFNDSGIARIYVNGTEASTRTVGGNLSKWNETYHLGLANEMTLNRAWLGELYLVAIYSRALSPQEIDQNFQAGVGGVQDFVGAVIDNGDSGTSFTGSWKISSGPDPFGDDSLFNKVSGSTYSFESPASGAAEIALWWTYYKNRCTDVPVEIYDDGTLVDTVSVNQQLNGAQWNVIGTYTFTGTAKVVVVSTGGCSTSADAARFE